MLLTKFLETTWTPSNRIHLENKGYKYKYRGKILIKIEDLPLKSSKRVDVLCDYCAEEGKETITSISYSDYTRRKNGKVNKDCCFACQPKKNKEIKKYLFENNQLSSSNSGYWSFKENRLKGVKNYIEKYGTIIMVSSYPETIALKDACYKFNETPLQLALELGYDINNIYKKLITKNKNISDDIKIWFNEPNNIIETIKPLLLKYKRFPTINEIINETNITKNIIEKHGGSKGLRKLLNYNDKNDLIDDRGCYNKSTYEYITAQFLIHNDVSYLREQRPFRNRKYRSDFQFILNSGEIIHVEVWGYSLNNTYKRGIDYNKKRKIKESLYDKYNLKLISIESELFLLSYDEIQKELYNIFKDILNLSLKNIKQEYIIPPNKLTDSEIIYNLKSINNDNKFPPIQQIVKLGLGSYIREIQKRYGNIYYFLKKHNLLSNNFYYPKEYWNDVNNLFDNMRYMIKTYNRVLTRWEINKFTKNDYILSLGIHQIMVKHFGSILNCKLEFFSLFVLKELNPLPEYEINWLTEIVEKRGNYKNKATQEQRDFANKILIQSKYNNIRKVG